MFEHSRSGVRLEWTAMPGRVRDGIERLLGSRVISTSSLAGGFSPGPAVRCALADGRVVFVKAAGKEPNPTSPEMHRREAEVLVAMPASVPAPTLVGVVDDGDWVALVVEWIDGAMPRSPLASADVVRVLRLVERLADAGRDAEIDGLQECAEAHPGLTGHWQQLLDEPLAGLGDWEDRRLSDLARLEADFADATRGTNLLHKDLRIDNMLFASDEDDDVVVDWPGACRGAAWVDLVGLLPSLRLDGGPLPQDAFDASSVSREADPDAVNVVLASLAGFFVRNSLLPPPPGLPTLRAFQAAQGRVACDWLRHRLDDG